MHAREVRGVEDRAAADAIEIGDLFIGESASLMG
jgi:hypothetical protein